jgi:photosystem II stability/assembly factor-like uncharacterized protein
MTVCLSPNGRNTYAGDAPARELLVATLDGITCLARDGVGAEWRVARRALEGLHVSALLWEPRRGGLFAGIHGHGLYRSLDGGLTWELKTTGLTPDHVYTVAAAERDGDVVLWAGTEPSHLFRSLDYGESWTELPALPEVAGKETWTFPAPPHTGHVKNVNFDPRDSRVIYAGVEQGALLKSADDGQTWRELDAYYRPEDHSYKDIHRVAIHPARPERLFLATGMGLYRSDDAGETWEHLTFRDSRVGYPDGLAFAPDNPDVVYMTGASQSPGQWRTSHEARPGVLRSDDAGRTWTELRDGLPDFLRANFEALTLASWSGGFSLFLGTTDGEVFASDDEGRHWARIATGLPPVSKVGHYRQLTAAAAGA